MAFLSKLGNTCLTNLRKNQDQVSYCSFSTTAKAVGRISCLASIVDATNNLLEYLTSKCVPSTTNKGCMLLMKILTTGPKAQKCDQISYHTYYAWTNRTATAPPLYSPHLPTHTPSPTMVTMYTTLHSFRLFPHAKCPTPYEPFDR